MTPMMLQYLQIKKEYEDYILMYRLGDFYEMFFEDAKKASAVLELTLTGRDCGEPERAPMCGVPFHSVDGYIEKLVASGYKVAICEQTEDPSKATGLVKREIVRLITPGTLTQASMLDESSNNYIACVYSDDKKAAVCFADISTGFVTATAMPDGDGRGCEDFVICQCGVYKPSEVLINAPIEQTPRLKELFEKQLECMVNDDMGDEFEPSLCLGRVREQFKNTDVTRLDMETVCCVGALLGYIERTQMTDISYLGELEIYSSGQYLQLDINARRSLELCETMRQGQKKGSLLWVLDHTETSGGTRLLKRWINEPLYSLSDINYRQCCIQALNDDFTASEELGASLKEVLDLQRLCTKVVYGSVNPRDMKAIEQTCACIPRIREILSSLGEPCILELCDKLDELSDVRERIHRTIGDDVPFSVREGGFIRDGFDEDLDRLRNLMNEGKYWIEQTERGERDATGIKNLKVAYNKVFGYYIEVSKSNIDQVPERYIRKQTLSGCERYITKELKELENDILGASDKIVKLEYEMFCRLRDELNENINRLLDTASHLSEIDALLSLSRASVKYGYVRPEVDMSDMIYIKDGRHPVVERFSENASFVPNDTVLDTSHNRLMLITGPNMAGKSTYMRQVALIVIMAHMGCFVPASEARIGLVDKIFTRVGASDDLALGQSTFMLEMSEVAAILKNATKKSLIIYDEIGRGTSTYDGMSIARACAEYTAKKIGAKALFATHYHELTELEGQCEGVVNYNIAAKKRGGGVIFLRKIVPGATDDSYGIEVAKLAGVPSEVTKRAEAVLSEIEGKAPSKQLPQNTHELEEMNVSLESVCAEQIRQKLKNTDLNLLNPLEAFDFLRELKKMV